MFGAKITAGLWVNNSDLFIKEKYFPKLQWIFWLVVFRFSTLWSSFLISFSLKVLDSLKECALLEKVESVDAGPFAESRREAVHSILK